jgi:hypothetical protein
VLKTIGPPAEGFENVLGPEATLPPARTEPCKALEPRFAFRVDFAAIEGLSLVLLAQDFVGRV